jgi:hypothetical protein
MCSWPTTGRHFHFVVVITSDVWPVFIDGGYGTFSVTSVKLLIESCFSAVYGENT